MNLQFTNKGGNFVSEFEVTSDFNLHIEGVRLSDMHIYQKTAGGSYAKVTDFPSERSQDRVADFDFASLVYPKFIKVVCATEPTYAEIATDGEVTEIKSQSKEVEITANGVTEIAPDAGFGYLSGVKVNVNVPTGGGESGGGDAPSGGSVEYLDVREYDFTIAGDMGLAFSWLCYFSLNINTSVQGMKMICPWGSIVQLFGNSTGVNEAIAPETVAFAIYPDMKVVTPFSGGSTPVTVAEVLRKGLSNNGVDYDSIPRISESEFYAL